MRSKLGTKSRLAAHILALVLLIYMLVYTAPDGGRVQDEPMPKRRTPSISMHPDRPASEAAKSGVGTLDRVHTPAVATRVEPEALRPPGQTGEAGRTPAAPAPGIAAGTPAPAATLDSATPVQPHAEPLRPPEAVPVDAADAPEEADAGAMTPDEPAVEPEADAEAQPEPESEPEPQLEPEPEAALEPEPVAESAAEPAPEPVAELVTEPDPAADEANEADSADTPESTDATTGASIAEATGEAETVPAPPQPDESGALVVADPAPGLAAPIAAATPLPNASLEVLGDGVYWLSPGHDIETELTAVPELRRLVFLAPLPGYRAQEFAHVKTDVIPADPADLTRDAAERFIHFTGGSDKPVVIAVLPGARGAAFFKGAYLLHNRSLTVPQVLGDIIPELDGAGEARDDIIHRLMRFAE